MTHSPPGRRAPRARRVDDAGPEQWLELPGWRRPLDTLLVLAVTFSAAWLALVVIPAAAKDGETPVADETVVADTPTAEETPDPDQWIAGPVYTGGPAAPTTAATSEVAVVAAPPPARAPAPRVVPGRTTSRAAAGHERDAHQRGAVEQRDRDQRVVVEQHGDHDQRADDHHVGAGHQQRAAPGVRR